MKKEEEQGGFFKKLFLKGENLEARKLLTVILCITLVAVDLFMGIGISMGSRSGHVSAEDAVELKGFDSAANIWQVISFGKYPKASASPSGENLSPTPEAVLWRVLSVSADKQEALLLADQVLDYQLYSTATVTPASEGAAPVYEEKQWKDSELHAWLNGTFLNTLAGSTGALREAVKKQGVKEGVEGSGYYAALPDEDEAKNASYGFSADVAADTGRKADATEHAKSQNGTGTNAGDVNSWLLYAAGAAEETESQPTMKYVKSDGSIGSQTYDKKFGIRPVLLLDITKTMAADSDTKVWTYMGTVNQAGKFTSAEVTTSPELTTPPVSTESPTVSPGGATPTTTGNPTEPSSASPSASPSGSPSASPSGSPGASPSGSPGASPSGSPSASPSVSPSATPTPTPVPTPTPSPTPTPNPKAPSTVVPLSPWYLQSPSAAPTASPQASLPVNTPAIVPTYPPVVTPVPAGTEGTEPKLLEYGTVKSVGKVKYSVIESAYGGGTVAVKSTGSKSYKKVTIPGKVKIQGISYKVTEVSKKAFMGMTKLEQVNIGKNVTTIGARAFENCRKLQFVMIGKNVTTIDKRAFTSCGKLHFCVINSGKISSVGAKSLLGTDYSMKLKVPKKMLKTYKKMFRKQGSLSRKAEFLTVPRTIKYKGVNY